MNDLVTVIVPVYNVKEYLPECIESIINQTYKNLEIIIVDDGSTDGSAEICDKLKKKDNRVVVIHQKNRGAGMARNAGLRFANGVYIGFVDADDITCNTYIEELYSAASKSDMGICGYDFMGEKLPAPKANDSLIFFDKTDLFKNILLFGLPDTVGCKGYLWNKLFRRDIILSQDLFFNNDYMMWEDTLFCCRYASFVNRAGCIQSKLYFYNKGNDQSISCNMTFRKMLSWVQAAGEVEQIVKENGMYDEVNYHATKADLYMKLFLLGIKENRLKEIDGEYIKFLHSNNQMLRKKYRLLYRLYNCCPTFAKYLLKVASI